VVFTNRCRTHTTHTLDDGAQDGPCHTTWRCCGCLGNSKQAFLARP
jgi:hypothetical protein